ncbi:MAG: hypothetical protein ABIH46_13760, partial [Chloroflexota bacterium]
GMVIKDAEGRTLYQEVPYDPAMGTIEMMRAMGEIYRSQRPEKPEKEIDPEKLVLQIKEELRKERPPDEGRGVSPEIQRFINDLKVETEQLGSRLAQIQHDADIKDAVRAAIEPLQARMEEVQSRSGMSESQFALKHRENLAGMWQGFLGGLVGGVREDIRPMIVQSAVAGMRQMGVPDEVITMAVSSFNAPSRPAGGALESKVAEARTRWLK